MDDKKLEAEVARLNHLLEEEKKKNVRLQSTIDAMREQEKNMAALYRGLSATTEGRLAHARETK